MGSEAQENPQKTGEKSARNWLSSLENLVQEGRSKGVETCFALVNGGIIGSLAERIQPRILNANS